MVNPDQPRLDRTQDIIPEKSKNLLDDEDDKLTLNKELISNGGAQHETISWLIYYNEIPKSF